MKCPICNGELIWQSDFMLSEIEGDMPEEEDRVVSTYFCQGCYSDIEIYHPSENMLKEYKKEEGK